MSPRRPADPPSSNGTLLVALVALAVIGAIAAFVVLQPRVLDQPKAVTATGEAVRAPTPEARVDKAVESAGTIHLSEGMRERLKRRKAVLAVDAPTVEGLAPDRETLDVRADPELRALFLGDDEEALARALLDRKAHTLLLHGRATPGIDRGRRVASRLYHHDQLAYFRLLRVSEDALLYQVLERPLAFPPDLARVAAGYLRGRLSGMRPGSFPDIQPEKGTGGWVLAATLRPRGGRVIAAALAQNDSFQGALEELVEDLERIHRRYGEYLGFPPLREHLADLDIEVHRVVERAYVEPRGESFLQEFWEMGVDGAYVMTADRKERGFLPGAASFTRSIRTADGFLRQVAKQGRMSERRPWRDPEAWLEAVRTIHYRQTPEGRLVRLVRGVPETPLDAVTVEAARQGVLAAADWYLRNLGPNGQVVYKFWPSENRYSDEYNLVRHTLATWNLVTAWRLAPDRADRDRYLEGARRALDYTQLWLKTEPVPGGNGEEMAYYSFNHNQKLGTVVVNLLGMIDLARATGDHEWDEQLRQMGRFVLFMQNDKGTFDGYYVEKGHPYYGQTNDIVPGEAALSLVYLADYFDDDSWIATLPAFWRYYDDGGWFRDRAKKRDDSAPWPRWTYDNDTRLELVQFGPWTVMAANAYHRRTGDAKVADFALEVARWMIETYEWDAARAPFDDYVGGYYKLPGELPAMQAFCYGEGTAAAYQLALRARPEQAAFFGEATRQTVRFALEMQYDDESTYAFSRPLQVLGGIRYAMNETKVRVDYVHHALSAMAQWIDGARADPGLAAAVRDGPALPRQLRQVERRDETLGRLPFTIPVKPIMPVTFQRRKLPGAPAELLKPGAPEEPPAPDAGR